MVGSFVLLFAGFDSAVLCYNVTKKSIILSFCVLYHSLFYKTFPIARFVNGDKKKILCYKIKLLSGLLSQCRDNGNIDMRCLCPVYSIFVY